MNDRKMLAGGLIAILITLLAIPVFAGPADTVADLQTKIRQARALMVQIRAAAQAKDWEAFRTHLNAYTSAMRGLNAQLSGLQQQDLNGGGLAEALDQIKDALDRLYDELEAACGAAGSAGGAGCGTARSVAGHGLNVASEVVQKAQSGNPGGPSNPKPDFPSIPGPSGP